MRKEIFDSETGVYIKIQTDNRLGVMMRKIIWTLMFTVLVVLAGCNFNKGDKISEMIDKGEYKQARKSLNTKLAENSQDSESSVLLAMSYRKEYYPTWKVRKFRTPLEGEWNLFPGEAMKEIGRYQEILDGLSQRGIWNNLLEEEYYFLLTYDYYRMKYKSDVFAENALPVIADKIVSGSGELADKAAFWNIYAENSYDLDFNWENLKPLILKYPESDLAGLYILQQIFTENVPAQLERLRDYKNKYPEYSLYADSLFIYRSIAGKKKLNSAEFENLLSENISVTVNRYILIIKAERAIKRGEVDSGLADLSKLINQEQDKYERDKLNLKLGKTAFKNNRYSLVISSFRQIEELSVSGKKQLWESYLEMDNEEDANNIYNELKRELNRAEIKLMDQRKYKFDLGKLKLSELNLVKGNGSVTIEGIVNNPTRKIYHGITVLLSLSDSKGNNVKERKLVIGELYSDTSEQFNEFIDYDSSIMGILFKGGIISFDKVE